METLECIENRRSARKFKNTSVEWEKIGNILRAGQLAPSSGNVQDFKFVVVTDKTKRSALANSALKQHWIASAPVIIVVYSEPKITQRSYGIRGDKLYAIQNSAAAAQNILLAATDEGLGSCWVGAFDENMVNSVLGAPDNARPQVLIPIGYIENDIPIPRKNRMVDMVYINNWGGKIVNPDLAMDDFSEVMRKKIMEAKEIIKEKAPTIGRDIAYKGKEGVKKIHDKVKEKFEERKKRKEKEFEKDLSSEEEVLEDSEI
ncbi:nitroreductase family protein [Candidatus Woesearchaeota archaeon]|nr:nitroreductase family protein [Candidatus Woesearchaeota archaeon]